MTRHRGLASRSWEALDLALLCKGVRCPLGDPASVACGPPLPEVLHARDEAAEAAHLADDCHVLDLPEEQRAAAEVSYMARETRVVLGPASSPPMGTPLLCRSEDAAVGRGLDVGVVALMLKTKNSKSAAAIL